MPMDQPSSRTHSSAKRACTICRAQKIKCDVVEDQPTPCSRCQRLKLDCKLAPVKRHYRASKNVTETSKRPLWPAPIGTSPPVSTASTSNSGIAPVTSSISAIQPTIEGGSKSSGVPSTLGAGVAAPWRENCTDSRPAILPAVTRAWDGETPSSSTGTPNTRIEIWDHGNVDPSSLSAILEKTPPATRTLDGLILESETVGNLYKIFFIEYSPSIPILDPTKSPDEYYELSPLLFWSIMAVASRRYRYDPTLLQEMSQRTLRLAMTSVGSISVNVHVVESLLILITWWLPNAVSIHELPFVLAGSLLHLAMHLGLHRPLRSQDYSRIKLYLTNQDIVRRSELWAHTIILYQRLCILNGNFFYSTQDFSKGPSKGNKLWNSLPPNLRYHSHLSGTVTQTLVSLANESQKVDDGASSTLIESLIKLGDTQLSELRPDKSLNTDPASYNLQMYHWLSGRLSIYSHHLHETILNPTSTTLELYDIACSVIKYLQLVENTSSNFKTTVTTFIFQTLAIAAFTILKLVKTPCFAALIDVSEGHQLISYARKTMTALSILDRDLLSKISLVLEHLWTSQKVFRTARGIIALGLRIRTRGPLSIVYDCAWWYREEFGGQPNAYGDSAIPIRNVESDNTSFPAGEPAASLPSNINKSTADPASNGPSAIVPNLDTSMTDATLFGNDMFADIGWDVFDDPSFWDPWPSFQT